MATNMIESSEYTTTIDGLSVTVSKDSEDWTVTVMNGPEYVFDNEVIRAVGTETHEEIAKRAARFASIVIDKS